MSEQSDERVVAQSGLPVKTFPIQDVEAQVKTEIDGKLRKRAVDLKRDCPINEFVQYECDEHVERDASGKVLRSVKCFPLVRLFRR
jgi:Mitochondrial export protein Som1